MTATLSAAARREELAYIYSSNYTVNSDHNAKIHLPDLIIGISSLEICQLPIRLSDETENYLHK